MPKKSAKKASKSPKPTAPKPPDRRDLFCVEYLLDLNAKKAAIRAGYSPKSAHAQGWRLLKEEKIQEKITALMAARTERVETDADRIIREIDDLALGSIDDILDFSGPEVRIRNANDISERGRRLISKVKIQTKRKADGTGSVNIVEFSLWNKPASLHLAMQHRGLLVNRHALTDPDGNPVPVEQKFIVEFVDAPAPPPPTITPAPAPDAPKA